MKIIKDKELIGKDHDRGAVDIKATLYKDKKGNVFAVAKPLCANAGCKEHGVIVERKKKGEWIRDQKNSYNFCPRHQKMVNKLICDILSNKKDIMKKVPQIIKENPMFETFTGFTKENAEHIKKTSERIQKNLGNI